MKLEEIYDELESIKKEYIRKCNASYTRKCFYYGAAIDGIDIAMMLIEKAIKEEKGPDV
nr:MAG TPA: hypothetical protein [Caudoviricetes sp.]